MSSSVESARGRSQTTTTKSVYVFGSSTPRELSHIKGVPKTARIYDHKPKSPGRVVEGKGIIYYMRQARSITPAAAGGRVRGFDKSYAFGSSTPRSLSHLSGMAPEQRIYDAKLSAQKSPGFRSITTSQISEQHNRVNELGNHVKKHSTTEDAASEPDIVQDRVLFDFSREQNARKVSKKKSVADRAGVAGTTRKASPAIKVEKPSIVSRKISKKEDIKAVQKKESPTSGRKQMSNNRVEAPPKKVQIQPEDTEEVTHQLREFPVELKNETVVNETEHGMTEGEDEKVVHISTVQANNTSTVQIEDNEIEAKETEIGQNEQDVTLGENRSGEIGKSGRPRMNGDQTQQDEVAEVGQ